MQRQTHQPILVLLSRFTQTPRYQFLTSPNPQLKISRKKWCLLKILDLKIPNLKILDLKILNVKDQHLNPNLGPYLSGNILKMDTFMKLKSTPKNFQNKGIKIQHNQRNLILKISCVKAKIIPMEVHNGECGNHTVGKAFFSKISRTAYYQPKMKSSPTKHF